MVDSDVLARHGAKLEEVRAAVGRVVVGQEELVERLLLALLCNGHVLLEGVPGVAKTLTASSLARAMQADFSRIQFTPDLLPGDLTGTLVYDPRDHSFTRGEGAGLRQPAAGGRGQPGARQGAVGAARGDAGEAGHARQGDLRRCRSRSWCWRPRTRSSRRAPTPCPRRRWTGSCSS